MVFALSFGALLACATAVSAAAVPRSNEEYDYVIVGGGLTGLVAAARLSEDPNTSVLVLEYGPVDRSNVTQIPFYASSLNTGAMRDITSAPEPGIGGKTFAVRAGAVAGGGSQVNGMQWDLPSAADFDSWEALDNEGWGWNEIQKYYKKASHLAAPNTEIEEEYGYSYDLSAHGNGPAEISFPEFQYPDMYNFKNAMDELGVPFVEEHTAGNAVGQYWTPTALNGETKTRMSSLYAYYDKVSSRSNLKLLSMHQANEIVFKGDDLQAEGVKALDRTTNAQVEFKANKEVILAAGAIFTPQLLQLSGIGPKSVLDAAGIETKLDMPAVGSNFQDHPAVFTNWNLTSAFPNPTTLSTNETFYAEALRLYHEEKTGPLTKAQASYVGFLSLETVAGADTANALLDDLAAQAPDAYLPDIYATDERLVAGFEAQREALLSNLRNGEVAVLELPLNGAGRLANALQKPLSRGTVHLNPADPQGVPVVFHGALQNPFDAQQVFANLQFTRKLFAADAMAGMQAVEVAPGAQYVEFEETIAAMVSSGALTPTFSHPSCSCPMMPEEFGGCVDTELKVYGTKGLSVIDASVLPIIPAAHLQATMYAVAEKASDIIKQRN